jgi:hypothetical protein
MILVCTGCNSRYTYGTSTIGLLDLGTVTGYCATTRERELQLDARWVGSQRFGEEDGWPDDADMVTPQSEN